MTETYSDSTYLKVLEAAPTLLLVLKPDFTIVAASEPYIKVANKTRKEMVGKPFFEAFSDSKAASADTMKELRSSFETVLKTKKSHSIPSRQFVNVPRADGQGYDARYLQSINTPIFNDAGELIFILRSVEDATLLVTQQDERKTIEQERDLFFNHSLDLMAVVGADRYFKRVNPAIVETLGYTEEELCSRPLVNFIHQEDVDITQKRMELLAKGTPTASSINRYRCKDGTLKWFSWNTFPLRELWFTVGRDITQQVEEEERMRTELRGSEAQILQLQKMDAVGRLAGGIAHDFNNMLAAIQIACDSLSEDIKNPIAVESTIKTVRDATARATALTRQLLVFSRKQLHQAETIQLNPLIEHLQKMLERLIGENIKIVTKFAKDLKPIRIDPSQMEQIVLNLVVNAKDAMPQGGSITIETSNVHLDEEFSQSHISVKPGNYIYLSIADTGSGMDADTMSKIFEPFFTTKPVGKGTGLGLTTTYGIVKQNQGTIWVYSELNKGTVFKIYLPVTEKVDQPTETVAPKKTEMPENKTILLVEDDPMLREAYVLALQKKKFALLVAASGEEALEILKKQSEKVDLLLTDMVMPGMSGYELSLNAKAIRKDIRVIFMSGYTADALENTKIQDLNEIDFIQKPFSINALLTKVVEVLGKSVK